MKSLKLVIVQTIECSMLFPLNSNGVMRASQDYELFASFLKNLKDRLRSGWEKISVITFNYDIGLEVALAQQNLPYEYCL